MITNRMSKIAINGLNQLLPINGAQLTRQKVSSENERDANRAIQVGEELTSSLKREYSLKVKRAQTRYESRTIRTHNSHQLFRVRNANFSIFFLFIIYMYLTLIISFIYYSIFYMNAFFILYFNI